VAPSPCWTAPYIPLRWWRPGWTCIANRDGGSSPAPISPATQSPPGRIHSHPLPMRPEIIDIIEDRAMKHRFLQLHVLTAFGPSSLNRDDRGMPKTAGFGNVPRLRVSSQSRKRAWRTSDVFLSALAGHLGTRTKKIGQLAMEEMLKAGLDEK